MFTLQETTPLLLVRQIIPACKESEKLPIVKSSNEVDQWSVVKQSKMRPGNTRSNLLRVAVGEVMIHCSKFSTKNFTGGWTYRDGAGFQKFRSKSILK